MGWVHASAQHTQKIQKVIRVKENRLHQVSAGKQMGGIYASAQHTENLEGDQGQRE